VQKDFKRLKDRFHKIVYELGGHIEEKSKNKSSGKQEVIYHNRDRSKHFMISWHTSLSDRRAFLNLRADIIRGCLSLGWNDIRERSLYIGARNVWDAETQSQRSKQESALLALWVELDRFFGGDEVRKEKKLYRVARRSMATRISDD
jgi:hypothetical protein